jgi:hypothetical protein
MNRLLPYLVGPEMYWAITCLVVRLAVRRHLPPDPAITAQFDKAWIVLPLIVVPLTFALFFYPGSSRWWLLLRIDLAIAVGLAIATTQFCNGMTYHQPSSGPGVGSAWMVMLSLGYTFMMVGTVIAVVIIWWRSRAPS